MDKRDEQDEGDLTDYWKRPAPRSARQPLRPPPPPNRVRVSQSSRFRYCDSGADKVQIRSQAGEFHNRLISLAVGYLGIDLLARDPQDRRGISHAT